MIPLLAQAVPQCISDADCDDGLFCTGTETCVAGSCAAVSACPPSIDVCVIRGYSCDEVNDKCVDFADDSLCDDGNILNGLETCDIITGTCQEGSPLQPSCSVPLFIEASDSPFDVGSEPQYGAVGDFNGDGKLDLIATNEADDTISVLLGNGDGSFGPQSTFAVGDKPASIAVDDLDGDGDLDLVVANEADDTISVLLGNGNGGFSLLSTFGNGAPANSVALGDFNEDGDLDLVVADEGRMRFGNGDGSFGSANNAAPGVDADFVTVGDVNGDGDLDLVLSDETDDTITVVLGNGDGTFDPPSSFTAGNGPSAVTLGHFDAGGTLDMALANENNPGTISVLLGNGNGTFGPEVSYPVGDSSSYVAVGDVNGDGLADLIAANEAGASISVLLGKGNGTFGPQTTFNVGAKPAFVAVGDYNSDGALDLAVVSEDDGSITVLLNQCLPFICRTAGFWGTHAGIECPKKQPNCGSLNITQAVLDECGGCLEICGEVINQTIVDSADSALEAICVSPKDLKLQLVRQLTALSLNCCVSGWGSNCSVDPALAKLIADCNESCVVNTNETIPTIGECVPIIDCINNGGIPLQLANPGFLCQRGTCSITGEPCDRTCPLAPGGATQTCVPLGESCSREPLCNEVLGLCYHQKQEKIAGSSNACTAANKSDCGVIPPRESQCTSGTKDEGPETCCGNGKISGDEECDEGQANGTTESCCTEDCQLKTAGTECRPVAGVCDQAESCGGSSPECPTDIFASGGTCRPADGDCDVAESCDGTGPDCPTDLYATGGVCRFEAGDCDVTDYCDGTGRNCPNDELKQAGTPCNDDSNPCTLDQCDGNSVVCQHPAGNAGTECRPAFGDCDAPESCDGSSPDCPSDTKISPCCGDFNCEGSEDENNCPIDCTLCGNGICGPDEQQNEGSCPEDCCGNDICSGFEDETVCPEDCTVCGNEICGQFEDENSCPVDCTFCGNSICGPFEDEFFCPPDCTICGNGICGPFEDAFVCPQDCGG
jgi:hypothetical protein